MNLRLSVIVAAFLISLAACNSDSKLPVKEEVVATPEELQQKSIELIRSLVAYAGEHKGSMGDSVTIQNPGILQAFYTNLQFAPAWSEKGQTGKLADSLRAFLTASRAFGLFPEDYHVAAIDTIFQRFAGDSTGRRERLDAALWSRADVLMTDAYFSMLRHVKMGRLPKDSVTLRKDSVPDNEFYYFSYKKLQRDGELHQQMTGLEPRHPGYQRLKEALIPFLETADAKQYTIVPSSKKDSLNYKPKLIQRLIEGGYLVQGGSTDSAAVADAVKAFQKEKGIAADGKAGEGTLRMLNMTDSDRFLRVAITMDRYKLLPETMPERYIWVNLPGFYMNLLDQDSVKVYSKIICGKPKTRTPLLNSNISNMITYPQWTVPASIIEKEILPAIKRDPGYLAKKDFSLIDGNGDEVDPYGVDWTKYKKGIPYRVVQGSGDANSLGILKFNFPNKYAVYLHDTNQRYLFAQAVRSLSHGCVRVQAWDVLAKEIVRYENKDLTDEDRKSPMEDSMNVWLARKEKHSIPVRQKLPVFIRYFTCEGKDGKLVFYDDIYGEDKWLRERYFAGK